MRTKNHPRQTVAVIRHHPPTSVDALELEAVRDVHATALIRVFRAKLRSQQTGKAGQ